MPNVFTREEIYFWGLIGENPLAVLRLVAEIKASGEPISVDELRNSIDPRFGSHPDPVVGNALLDGSAATVDAAKLKAIAEKAVAWLAVNNPAQAEKLAGILTELSK